MPAGTVLRPTSGRTITVANSVINGEDINGCLRIEATGVLIRNSRITCRSGWAISNFSGGSMRVQDVTITCAGTGNGGIGGRVVALRNNISQCENGGGGNTDVTWEDNWVHDLACGGDFHSDAYQIGDNSNRMTFRHNRFDQSCSAGQGGTAAIIGDTGTHTDVLIENNYLTGRGSYTVYCPWNPTRYVLRNNLIGASTYGRYYPSCDGRAGQTITGNVPV